MLKHGTLAPFHASDGIAPHTYGVGKFSLRELQFFSCLFKFCPVHGDTLGIMGYSDTSTPIGRFIFF